MPRRGTILIIIGILLALGTTAVVFMLLRPTGEKPAVGPEPAPEEKISVVIATQEIPAFTEIPVDAVGTLLIPQSALSDAHLLDPEAVVGKKTVETLTRGSFITRDLLLDETKTLQLGYDASLHVPPGRVAIAFQTKQLNAVAGAIQNGDFVDILISYWLVDTEEEVGGGEEEEGEQKESYILLAQLTLQEVEVLRVGPWASIPPSDEVSEEEQGEGEAEGEEEEEKPSPVVPSELVVFTLLLDQQDALVLKFARESGASIDLVLRSLDDHNTVHTETVSLEYVMTRFEITLPPEPMRFVPRSYRD